MAINRLNLANNSTQTLSDWANKTNSLIDATNTIIANTDIASAKVVKATYSTNTYVNSAISSLRSYTDTDKASKTYVNQQISTSIGGSNNYISDTYATKAQVTSTYATNTYVNTTVLNNLNTLSATVKATYATNTYVNSVTTADSFLTKIKTVDGPTSGLDADLLDGQEGSFYTAIAARLGYTPVNKAGDTVTGNFTINSTLTVGSTATVTGKIIGKAGFRSDHTVETATNVTNFGYFSAANQGLTITNYGATHASLPKRTSISNFFDSANRQLIDFESGGNINFASINGVDGVTVSGNKIFHAGNFTPANYQANLLTEVGIELNRNGTGDRTTYIDLHSSGTPGVNDYSARFSREGGVDGKVLITQTGQGTVDVAGGANFTRNGNTVWHAGNDGAGSGLDADLLDGFSSSTAATVNTIALRDSNGDLAVASLTSAMVSMSHTVASRATDTVFYTSTDNFIRKNDKAGMIASLGVLSKAGDTVNGAFTVAGVLTVDGGTLSRIILKDSDHTTMSITNNSNIMYFGNETLSESYMQVSSTGAISTKQFGDLNTRIETRAAAFASDAETRSLPRAGGTMTGDFTVQKIAPQIQLTNSSGTQGGYIDFAHVPYGHGDYTYRLGHVVSTNRFSINYVTTGDVFSVGTDGSITTAQFGDLNSRIEARASAYASERILRTGDTFTGNFGITNTQPTITLTDTDQGTNFSVHCNSGYVGFINPSGWRLQVDGSGNVYSPTWTGSLNAFVEARGQAWANDRVANLQYRTIGETYQAGANGAVQAPTGTTTFGLNLTGGSSGQVLGQYYRSIQVYDPVRGWVGFSRA